jgi:hypothetical protein
MLDVLSFMLQPVVWIPGALLASFIAGMCAGWLASNHSAARDADNGQGYIYWRARRYRVIPDDDPEDERKNTHAHGTMAEQSWP